MRILLAAAVIMIAGCTKGGVGCKAAERVSDIVSKEVALQLECSNVDAIKAFMDAQVEKAKICQAGSLGIIGDIMCPSLVSGAISGVVSQIPAEWECKGGLIKDVLKDQLMVACKKAF